MNPPEPLQAPPHVARNPDDPLSPERLARLDLSATQAIVAYRELLRVAKHPESEPNYRQIREALVRHEAEYEGALAVAATAWNDANEIKAIAAKLDMSKAKNVELFADAAADHRAAESRFKDLWYKQSYVREALAQG